jgi:hypothetical protein
LFTAAVIREGAVFTWALTHRAPKEQRKAQAKSDLRIVLYQAGTVTNSTETSIETRHRLVAKKAPLIGTGVDSPH